MRLHPLNPYSQAIIRITDWITRPLGTFLPLTQRCDWPSLVASWLTAFIFLLLTWVLITGHTPPLSSLLPALLASIFTVLKWALNLILWLTIIQAVLSWINPLAPIMPVLHILTAPLLNPIRRILPNLGGIDLSPLVVLILAQIGMMLLSHLAFSFFGV